MSKSKLSIITIAILLNNCAASQQVDLQHPVAPSREIASETAPEFEVAPAAAAPLPVTSAEEVANNDDTVIKVKEPKQAQTETTVDRYEACEDRMLKDQIIYDRIADYITNWTRASIKTTVSSFKLPDIDGHPCSGVGGLIESRHLYGLGWHAFYAGQLPVASGAFLKLSKLSSTTDFKEDEDLPATHFILDFLSECPMGTLESRSIVNAERFLKGGDETNAAPYFEVIMKEGKCPQAVAYAQDRIRHLNP